MAELKSTLVVEETSVKLPVESTHNENEEMTSPDRNILNNFKEYDKIENIGRYTYISTNAVVAAITVGAIGFECYEIHRKKSANTVSKTFGTFVKLLGKMTISFSLPICLGFATTKYQEKTKIYGVKVVPPYLVLFSIGLMTHVRIW